MTDSASNPASSQILDWDEARSQAALADLERLQEHLDELRLTIPRMLQPLNTAYPSPVALYQDFRKEAIGATNDLKKFRSLWHSQETQQILDHAKESQERNPDLSASVHVPQYGWIDGVSAQQKHSSTNSTGGPSDNLQELADNAVVSKTVETFKAEHPNLIVHVNADIHIIDIFLNEAAQPLTFRIILKKEANGDYKLEGECLGTTDLSKAITRCIATRPRTNDLRYLLDMIATYRNARGAICSRCSHKFDHDALVPTARRSKQVEQPEGKSSTVWEAIHECCL